MKDRAWLNLLIGMNLLIGIWLVIVAFVLVPASMAHAWNDVIFGIVLIVSSWFILVLRPVGTVWFEALVGIWLIAAPFVLKYGIVAARPAAGQLNEFVCGVVTVVVSLFALQGVNRPTRIA
jgi:hypothetical protein